MSRVIPLAEWRARVGASAQVASRWARDGRLPGAYKSPDTDKGLWLLPEDTQRPGRPVAQGSAARAPGVPEHMIKLAEWCTHTGTPYQTGITWARAGRLTGAYRVGKTNPAPWYVPRDTLIPDDLGGGRPRGS